MAKRVLYCGDGAIPGAAAYLYGVLVRGGWEVDHLPSRKIPTLTSVKRQFDLIILSDFEHARIKGEAEKRIAEQVKDGCGLWMIGGWGSFTGIAGGYRGTLIESILPVKCAAKDDRVNYSSGTLIFRKKAHPALKGLSFKTAPVVAGYNAFTAKKGGEVILTGRQITAKGDSARTIQLAEKEIPFLVVGNYGKGRTAALAPDVAPHWVGGLVDWGSKRVTLDAVPGYELEVGSEYVKLLLSIAGWLARNNS